MSRSVGGRPACSPLAVRAVPRPASGDARLRQRAAAAVARLALPAVDTELALHRAALAIRCGVVAKRRSLPGDAEAESAPDAAKQSRQLGRLERSRRAQRRQPCVPERLVDVDVPEACSRTLVEQRRLQRGAATRKAA